MLLALDDDGHILGKTRVDHVSDAGTVHGGPGVVGPTGPPMDRALHSPVRTGSPGRWVEHETATTNTMRRGAPPRAVIVETVVRELIVDIAARRSASIRWSCGAGTSCRRLTSLDHSRVRARPHHAPAETLEQAVDLIGYEEFRVAQGHGTRQRPAAGHRHRLLRPAEAREWVRARHH